MAKTNETNSTAPVVSADKAFKSRTIVLEDGRTFAVEKAHRRQRPGAGRFLPRQASRIRARLRE